MEPVTQELGSIDTGTKLAVDRTRLAYERTMMAWVRTAASLISFGFTIYKFFELNPPVQSQLRDVVLGPREFAIAMIGIALASLLLSTFHHQRSMQTLRAQYAGMIPPSTATFVGAVFSVFGFVALMAVLLHL
jgi:putative membrane protein